MTRKQQASLIRAYCKHTREGMLDKLKDAPKEWDGRELRNWFVEYVRQNYTHDLGRKGTRDLHNDIIVRNLT